MRRGGGGWWGVVVGGGRLSGIDAERGLAVIAGSLRASWLV